jgi:hypothetical protein
MLQWWDKCVLLLLFELIKLVLVVQFHFKGIFPLLKTLDLNH